jgi:hypothetical protein
LSLLLFLPRKNVNFEKIFKKGLPVMLENIMVTYHQTREAWSTGGLKDVFRPRAFLNRIATPTEMDLSRPLSFPTDLLQDLDYRFVELNLEDLLAGKWSFAVRSRCFKALRNLRKGWRNFALVEDATIMGDVWCDSVPGPGNIVAHPDLKMLGIDCKEKEVYAFDMLIAPQYRGKNLAVPLQRFLHVSLKNEGFRKVYGFYWDDNLPALWMHRMLKYKELPKRRISRFFFLHKYRNASLA